jgi:hypothetical protein
MSEVIEAPAAQTTDIATLPPADRAALVLNSTKTEADLKQLAESLKAITLVNSKAGRDQAHALAMTATKARTAITKVGKTAREDATKFSAAVIAEEKRLIGLISEQEDRVFGLRDAWDAAEAARKEAEAQKERDRIAAHQAVITQINSYPGLAREARTSAMALQLLEKLQAINTFNNCLEEFTEAAHAAKIAATEQLDAIIEAKQTAEAEQARIKAEQEAEAARLAEERKRMEAERAEAARLAAEQQAELLAMQAKMKAQQEELDRQAAAMAQQAAELAARKAEAEKPAEVPAATLAADPRNALAQIIPQAMAEQLVPAALIQQTATADEMHDIGKGIMYGQVVDAEIDDKTINNTPEKAPSAINLANTIAFEYGVEPAHAIRWLAERADEFKTMYTITEVTP